jgi:hypothetical protein
VDLLRTATRSLRSWEPKTDLQRTLWFCVVLMLPILALGTAPSGDAATVLSGAVQIGALAAFLVSAYCVGQPIYELGNAKLPWYGRMGPSLLRILVGKRESPWMSFGDEHDALIRPPRGSAT